MKPKESSVLFKTLKQENEGLRQSLKQLSSEIDGVLEQATKFPPTKPLPASSETKTKDSYQKMIKSMEVEMEKLESRATMNTIDRRIELEEKITETTQTLRKLQGEIRNLHKDVHDKGNLLANSEDETESSKLIKILNEELRQAQTDYRDLQEKFKRQTNFNVSTKTRIQELEQLYNEMPKVEGVPERDKNSEILAKKQELVALINEKNEVQVRMRKQQEEVDRRRETQVKSNTLLQNQIKNIDSNAKTFDTQARVIRQQIKNLSRNPNVPVLAQGGDVNPVENQEEVKEEEVKEKEVKEEEVKAEEVKAEEVKAEEVKNSKVKAEDQAVT